MVRRFLLSLALVASLTGPALAFRHLAPGKQIKPVSLIGVTGGPIQLGAASGSKATLVLFWATWSPRSLAALADFEKLHRKYAAEGLQVVAVNVEGEKHGNDDGPRISAAMAAAGVSYAAARDLDLSLYDTWGVCAVPSAVLTDGTGRVLEILDGYPPVLTSRINHVVAQAIGAEAEGEQAAASTADTALALQTSGDQGQASR